jgi:CRISPR-associated endonuclease/helicase Cas3
MGNIPPWGKFDESRDDIHHLSHHCADVAACFEALARLPVVENRLNVVAGGVLDAVTCARLTVLAFLHDAGKLHPGFQAKGWPKGVRRGPLNGHVHEGAAIFTADFSPQIAQALCFDDLSAWLNKDALFATLAHHGRPFREAAAAERGWRSVQTPNGQYDPLAAASEIGAMMHRWFPAAFAIGNASMPNAPGLWHLFCGLVTLADWIGSDRDFFPYVRALEPDYIGKARVQAARAIGIVGLDTASLSRRIAACSDFSCVAEFAPNAQQKMVGACDPDERLGFPRMRGDRPWR